MNISEFTSVILQIALYPFSNLSGHVFVFCTGCIFFIGCFALFRKLFSIL